MEEGELIVRFSHAVLKEVENKESRSIYADLLDDELCINIRL